MVIIINYYSVPSAKTWNRVLKKSTIKVIHSENPKPPSNNLNLNLNLKTNVSISECHKMSPANQIKSVISF